MVGYIKHSKVNKYLRLDTPPASRVGVSKCCLTGYRGPPFMSAFPWLGAVIGLAEPEPAAEVGCYLLARYRYCYPSSTTSTHLIHPTCSARSLQAFHSIRLLE